MSPDRPLSPFAAVAAFVDALFQAGVTDFCISPGSRSTPLAEYAARHPGITARVLIDERSSAFFALGMAKARRHPVALVCTSGTAAANFYPAVIEARYARVPLVVLTADRPPEAREIGSAQTIDQIKLYGNHVAWFVDMPLPEGTPPLVRYFRGVAGRAVAEACGSPPGPVHINLPFREPLTPPRDVPGERGVPGVPPAHRPVRLAAPPPEEMRRVAREVRRHRRGLIVCGPQEDGRLPAAVARLAELLDVPVLADPLSQLRSGAHDRSRVIDAYDLFLRDPAIAAGLECEYVIRFGSLPTSKTLAGYLGRQPGAHVSVDAHGWIDPLLAATELIRADPVEFCRELAAFLLDATGGSGRTPAAPGAEWTGRWLELNRLARTCRDAVVQEFDGLFEGRVVQELASLLPAGAVLFAGNSMPVRDLDAYFSGGEKPLTLMANRGANGIDGVVSTALGAAVARRAPLALVVGDLSFLHDLNGLFAARLCDVPVVVVVVNNDGGGIFSFLPQASESEHFEALFGTPHGLGFEHAARLFGLPYARPRDWREFGEAVRRGLQRPGVSLVEVTATREESAARRRTVQARTLAALARPEGASR